MALGTSLPDTFASKAAAVGEKYADNAVGNVTGSNSVNVFLGLGLPWVIATIYHASKVLKANEVDSVYLTVLYIRRGLWAPSLMLPLSFRVASSLFKPDRWDLAC